MDATVERECSALGCLFQQIIQDMKNGAPLWEDLISKATKLHTCLKAAILAISAFLEAFQKIADAATNARGATREIGTALTRICLRHKAVETRVKSFTSAIMDCLILPLQDKLEDWKKSLVYLDKEHAKEYKKARTELKKKSSDTLRLQKKKARKGFQQQQIYGTLPHATSQGNASNLTADPELGRLLESSAAVVQEKRQTLEETERKAVRAALLEERGRFCQFAKFLKPVLDEEISMLMELTHLQEVADQLQKHTASPQQLPPASEQVIIDIKGRDPAQWSLATPPSSPSLSLGSRKSSVCSISSLNSSSSGSCKSHPSPSAGHPSCGTWHRSVSQQRFHGLVTLRYRRSINSGSRDSGFTSLQETLIPQPMYRKQVSCTLPQSDKSSAPSATSTWPDLQRENARAQLDPQDPNSANERPHTISTAYEKGHQRPALSVYTFQAPDQNDGCQSQPASPVSLASINNQQNIGKLQQRKNSSGSIGREKPPIPNRCSSLERPSVPARIDSVDPSNQRPGPDSPRAKAKFPIPAHLAKEIASQQTSSFQQPMYVNMHELASLAASRAQEMHPPPPPPPSELDDVSVTDGMNIEAKSSVNTKTEIGAIESNGDPDMERSSASSVVQRRASLQQSSKPAPPTRRVSALVGENSDERGNTHEDLDSLPPPPAFLLEGSSPPSAAGSPATQRRSISVSETVRTLTELRHTPASPSLLRRKVATQAQVHVQSQVQAHVRALSTGDEKSTIRINNICPAAVIPGTSEGVERTGMATSRSGSRDRHSSPGPRSSSIQTAVTIENASPASSGVASSFISVLSAKLTSGVNLGNKSLGGANSAGNSPKPIRKLSNADQPQQNRNSKTSNEFLETLNARLAQQQHHQQQQVHQQAAQQQMAQHQLVQQQIAQQQIVQLQRHGSIRSASVRRFMANRMPMLDPLQVRDSLMDQIRRGTSLRKTTGPINDRSAPKIY